MPLSHKGVPERKASPRRHVKLISHISIVTGTLRREFDGVDALKVLFPCGSIIGAPKIRAMQILDDIEPVRRGVAMGAVGYFGFGGDMEWNVAIRTLTCRNEQASWHAGGGIVWIRRPIRSGANCTSKPTAAMTTRSVACPPPKS
jgi:para-aminobenzoate synthetase component 1